MVRVTINKEFRSKLGRLDAPLELCDETGRVLGHFIPQQNPAIYDGAESPVCDEEIGLRLREDSERPLEDILRDLDGRQ